MKRILYLLLGAMMVIGLASCDKEKPRSFDPQANLFVNVKNKLRSMNVETRTLPVIEGDPQEVLSPREVVIQSVNFIFDDIDGYTDVRFGISDEIMKDPDNERIIMWNDQIIRRDGSLDNYFLDAKNIRIENGQGLAIAYIPQSVVKAAWIKIKAAYDAGDYDTVYQLFQDAYTAIPCTQMQWEALKAKGEN